MRWRLNKSLSSVEFSVKHLMFSRVNGSFEVFDADVELDPDDLSSSDIDATVDVNSIDTGDEGRDEKLRSPGLFDVETYPSMHFESTDIEADGQDVQLTGNLTISGVTREISLTGHRDGPTETSEGEVINFELAGTIERDAFELTWNEALETGNILVGNEVEVELEIQLEADEI